MSSSRVVIFSKMAACTSQAVAFNRHPSTCGHLTGLRNNPQKKTDQSTIGIGVVVISCCYFIDGAV